MRDKEASNGTTPSLSSNFLGGNIAFFLKTAVHSTVVKNAGSLYIIQFANYILPLVMVPYLVRVLGPSVYGTLAFGGSLIGYFVLFVGYGFDLSGTRQISVNRHDVTAVSRTVFTIWTAKLILCMSGLILLLFLVAAFSKLRAVWMLLLILYGRVIGDALFPSWLFQGMEEMIPISLINLAMRLFVLIGLFLLVHYPQDYLLYAGLISLGSIGAGLAGAAIGLFRFKLRPFIPSWDEIWQTLREGWTLFLSRASVSVFSVGNAFILGIVTNNTVVGYYAAGEKIVSAVNRLLLPISQAAYPRFSKIASESKAKAIKWGKRMLMLMGGIGLILFTFLVTGAPVISRIILGPQYESSIMVIRIIAAVPLVNAIANVLGVQIMLPFGKDKAYMKILLMGAIINIALAIALAPIWQESGMAAAVLITATFIPVAMLTYLKLTFALNVD
jgi:PST family polysaccharide transporter